MKGHLEPGSVVWVELNPTVGREQAVRRPAVVVCSAGYLRAVPDLAVIVPATTTRRGWPQHVEVAGAAVQLAQTTFAMTEQPRTISRQRIVDRAGLVDESCLLMIRRWLDDFLLRD